VYVPPYLGVPGIVAGAVDAEVVVVTLVVGATVVVFGLVVGAALVPVGCIAVPVTTVCVEVAGVLPQATRTIESTIRLLSTSHSTYDFIKPLLII
jgi:hypothetical protein